MGPVTCILDIMFIEPARGIVLGGARQVLTAAAFTYIAAAISSILTLLYYVSLVSRRD